MEDVLNLVVMISFFSLVLILSILIFIILLCKIHAFCGLVSISSLLSIVVFLFELGFILVIITFLISCFLIIYHLRSVLLCLVSSLSSPMIASTPTKLATASVNASTRSPYPQSYSYHIYDPYSSSVE